MRSTFGRTVDRHPIVFSEGTFGENRSFSFFGFGGYSPREAAARDELAKAAYENSLFSETFVAKKALKDKLWQERLARIHRLTGQRLKNPADEAFWAAPEPTQALWSTPTPLTQFFKDNSGLDQRRWGDAAYRYEQHYFKQFRQQLEALSQQYPEHAAELLSFGERGSYFQPFAQEEMLGRAAAAHARYEQAARTPYLSDWQKSKQEMGASTLAFLSDPISTGSMFIPYSGAAKGATFLARVGRVMLLEAAINAGTEAALQAATYQWRRDIGMDVSLEDSLRQIGTVGAIGGVVGGVMRGGAEGVAKLIGRHEQQVQAQIWDAIGRVERGEAGSADLEMLAKRLNVPIAQVEARSWQMAEAQDRLLRAAFGDVPDGVQVQDTAGLVDRVLADVYGQSEGALLHGADYAPKREAGLAQILDDGFTPKRGAKLDVGGRPVAYRQFEPEKIGVDASNYQYKSGDAQGVNGRLGEVTRWEESGAGKVFVHSRKDGMFIVDGHQRLDVARRLPRQEAVKLNGYLFAEKDGWTIEDVRALAAQKNIGEGSGSVMDGAGAIRERPEIVDDGLPVNAPEIKDMLGLARLSDEAWASVTSGAVKPEYGAVVGRMVPDEAGQARGGEALAEQGMQARVLEDLGRAQPATQEEAAALIGESLEAGQKREKPDGFGGSGKVENEPEILKPQQNLEPATKQAVDMAERELAVMEGRLADKQEAVSGKPRTGNEKNEVTTMWAHIARDSVMDEGFVAKQADVMANVVRMCKF